ncbi:MAG: metal-binding protein [Symploca sp. SIO2B6]|nr:metal-binding protein [Symploca sp. SIO2B6]
MPSGFIHDRITLWSCPVITGLSLARTHNTGLTLAVATGFLLGGLMLGPDLDTHSVHYKRWGWFRWVWLPYRHYIRHRSPLSHGPLIGTTIRVCYLLLWLLILGSFGIVLLNELLRLGWTWNQVGDRIYPFITSNWPYWIALAIGLELGAISHILADWFTSAYKRVRKHYPREGWQALGRILNASRSPSRTKSNHKQRNKTKR